MPETGARSLFLMLATGLVAVILTTFSRLPPVVASHFDARGVPNGWSTRPVYALFLILIGVLLPLGIVWLITALTRSGITSLSIPARDYWTRPQNAPEAVRRIRGYIWWLACVMTITALLVHWSVLVANAKQPPRLETSSFLVVLGAIVLALGIWTAGWYRLLRPPRGR